MRPRITGAVPPGARAMAAAAKGAAAGKTAPRKPARRRRAVPPRSLADLPVVDQYVSASEGCVDAVTPALLGPRLGTQPGAVQEFLESRGVPVEASDTCVPYVAVTGGADGAASLHVASPAPQPAAAAPAPGCEPSRRVIEVPVHDINPGHLGPLLDVPVRVRWQLEALLPEMAPLPETDGEDAPATIARVTLERRGPADPERLQSLEILDAVTRRRLDAAWWVERSDGPGVLFGLNGTDYERLLWNSAVHFERVARGVGPSTRVVKRVVRQGKGQPRRVVTRVVKPRGYHLGIDLMADRGADVHAVADGIVAFAGTARGFGKLVIVDHGRGYKTYYAHLSAFARGLRPGDVLLRGDVLGLVGSTGRSSGPHLHFETRRGNDYIDPRDVSRQLEFWILTPEEQAWIARQILATAATTAVLPEGEDAGVPEHDDALGGPRASRPAAAASVSMVVAPEGTAVVESGLDVPACRAYAQVSGPERPELPKPAARRPARKRGPPKVSGAAKKTAAARAPARAASRSKRR